MNRFITFALLAMVLFTACEQKTPYTSQLEEVFPPVPIFNAALFRINNLPVTPPFFQGQWTLVALGNETCDPACQSRLKSINGLKNAQKLFFAEGLADHRQLGELAAKYTDIAITSGTMAASVDNFMRQFDVEIIEPASKKDYLYLVNPQAQLEFVLAKEHLNPDIIQQEINGLMSRDAS